MRRPIKPYCCPQLLSFEKTLYNTEYTLEEMEVEIDKFVTEYGIPKSNVKISLSIDYDNSYLTLEGIETKELLEKRKEKYHNDMIIYESDMAKYKEYCKDVDGKRQEAKKQLKLEAKKKQLERLQKEIKEMEK